VRHVYNTINYKYKTEKAQKYFLGIPIL